MTPPEERAADRPIERVARDIERHIDSKASLGGIVSVRACGDRLAIVTISDAYAEKARSIVRSFDVEHVSDITVNPLAAYPICS